MKKTITFIICILFALLCIDSQVSESKTTYKVPSDGSLKPAKIPKGTPKKPSKAAKLNLTVDSSDVNALTDESKSGNNVKKDEKKEKTSKTTKTKKKTTSKVSMYNRVNEIGEKLLESSNIAQDVAFSLSSGSNANAYTNKYNQITINRGLVNFAESDDEIAAILGHELGHVLNYDVKKSIRDRALTKIIAINSTSVIDSGLLASSILVSKKKSRNREYSADIAGIDMMVNAGYNPLAMISIMNKITDHYNDIASTHPTGRKRLLAMYNYIETYYPKYIEEGYPTVSYRNALRIIDKN